MTWICWTCFPSPDCCWSSWPPPRWSSWAGQGTCPGCSEDDTRRSWGCPSRGRSQSGQSWRHKGGGLCSATLKSRDCLRIIVAAIQIAIKAENMVCFYRWQYRGHGPQHWGWQPRNVWRLWTAQPGEGTWPHPEWAWASPVLTLFHLIARQLAHKKTSCLWLVNGRFRALWLVKISYFCEIFFFKNVR